MNLHIKKSIFLVLLLITQVLLAQDSISVAKPKRTYYHGLFVGYMMPSGIFANKGYSKGLKYNHGLDFQLLFSGLKGDFGKHILMGYGMSFMKADVVDIQAMGNYTNPKTFAMNVNTGYAADLNRYLEASIRLGVGLIYYKGEANGDGIRDTGVSLTMAPLLRYSPYKYFGLYISPAIQYNKMDTNAPKIDGRNFRTHWLFLPTLGITLF